MVNLGARDKRVLKMTICKGSDREDVQRIIAFAYRLINPCAAFTCKGQDHRVEILNVYQGVNLNQSAALFVLHILLLFPLYSH